MQCNSMQINQSQVGDAVTSQWRDLYESTAEPKYDPTLIMSWESWVEEEASCCKTALLLGTSEQMVENDVWLSKHLSA